MPGQRIRSCATREHGPAVPAYAAAAAWVALTAVVVGACGFTANYDGTTFLCETEPRRCPDGFDCYDGVCLEQAPRVDAAPIVDAALPDAGAPDAAVDFCAEAMDDPVSESCATAHDLTAAASAAGGVTVYGDTEPLVNDVGTVSSGCLSLALPGRDAIYRVDLAAGQTLTATLVAEWNSALYLIDACLTGATCFAGDTNGSATPAPETIQHTATAPATFYLVIDNIGPGFGCFQLQATLD